MQPTINVLSNIKEIKLQSLKWSLTEYSVWAFCNKKIYLKTEQNNANTLRL